ncbi:unnamed protein product [Cochlearia groenlandica]
MASMDTTTYHPTPNPDHDTTVVVLVFVSLGCISLMTFLTFVIWFLIKKKSKKHCERNKAIRVDEHFTIKEAIVELMMLGSKM